MVEGHSVHRVASRFRQLCVGKKFHASSPNGRFVDGAAAIDGGVLRTMEAVGKNLFAFFSIPERGNAETVVHVHFGMSGAWSLHNIDEEPDVKPTTRLRLEQHPNDDVLSSASSSSSLSRDSLLVAHLSAMTCNYGSPELFETKRASLGQDPLRADANPDALYAKVVKSKKSIGALLMDQSFFAGPGNIYRAEILFLAGVHPETPGTDVDRTTFDRVWSVAVALLRRGYDTGSILTIDALVDPGVAARGERRYIYNRSDCARCGGLVRSWDMNARTCYVCEGGCQPRISSQILRDGRSSSVTSNADNTVKGNKTSQATKHIPFVSHCAPDGVEKRLRQNGPEGLTIKEIRAYLKESFGADSLPSATARKSVQVKALADALAASPKKGINKKDTSPADVTSALTSSAYLSPPAVSAEDAAREKATAGEHRGVEHVAELSGGQAAKAIGAMPLETPKRSLCSSSLDAPVATQKNGSRKRKGRAKNRRDKPEGTSRVRRSRRRLEIE